MPRQNILIEIVNSLRGTQLWLASIAERDKRRKRRKYLKQGTGMEGKKLFMREDTTKLTQQPAGSSNLCGETPTPTIFHVS